jgi:uncharacterized protein (TIGR02594 family)
MYRFILAFIVALGVMIPAASIAAPNTEKTVQVKKPVVKKYKRKKVKKKAVKVEEARNPFIRCENKDCSPKPVTPIVSYAAAEEMTAAQFFREDQARMQMQKLTSNPIKLTQDQKRQAIVKGCSWFTCFKDNAVVIEAKAWEGKTAKKDRKELRSLFADGNMPPIDPVRTPWCAAFANAILSRSGYETTKSLMARSFLTWGVNTKDPKDGDIVVLKRGRGNTFGHVGFFQGYEVVDGVTYVKVLGGNTDHAVQVGYYPVNKVLGYRTAIA